MRNYLILLLLLFVACEEDPAFYKEDIDAPRLDSILERQMYFKADSFYLFGRSSGERDMPVSMFFYSSDTAEDIRFFRSMRFDAYSQYREFFPQINREQNFWQSALYPLYEGDVYIRASYMINDTMFLSRSLNLKHWDKPSAEIPDIDIDTRNPRNPRFRWERDQYGTDIYLLGISDWREDMLATVVLSDTNYRFYDVFTPFDYVGPEYTQPELIQNERYNIHLMGLDTLSGWVSSYSQKSFVAVRE